MKRGDGLSAFLAHCCRSRRHSFEIKKYASLVCNIYGLPNLPPEMFEVLQPFPNPFPEADGQHFKTFDSVYGTATAEDFGPSLKTATASPLVKLNDGNMIKKGNSARRNYPC